MDLATQPSRRRPRPRRNERPEAILRVGLTGGSGADTLDAHKGLTYLDTARAQSLYSPLLQLNRDAQTELELAEEITPNGSTSEWVIRLRAGVTFHNGKDLTADDVIFTLQRILNPKAPLTGATSLGPVGLKGLKKLDRLTVRVPMTSPYESLLDQLAYWYCLYIVPVGYDPTHPVGTGPFRFDSFTPGRQSVFKKFDSYWKPGLPYVDEVTIIDFPDSASLQNALLTNAIDGAGALEGPQLKSFAGNSAIRTVASPTGDITPFTMRVDVAPFNDVRVRRAFCPIVGRRQG